MARKTIPLLNLSDNLKRELSGLADEMAMDASTVDGGLSNRALAQLALDRVTGALAKEVDALIKANGYAQVERAAVKVVAN